MEETAMSETLPGDIIAALQHSAPVDQLAPDEEQQCRSLNGKVAGFAAPMAL